MSWRERSMICAQDGWMRMTYAFAGGELVGEVDLTTSSYQ
jgi:hypothetical protein